MLHARTVDVVVLRNVHAQLVTGMRVQCGADRVDGLPDGAPISLRHGLFDQREVLGLEHVAVWEGQPVDRIVGRTAPVDQFVDDVAADLERQHLGHHVCLVPEHRVAGTLGDELAEPVAADRSRSEGCAGVEIEDGHLSVTARPQSKSTSPRTFMSDISEYRPL